MEPQPPEIAPQPAPPLEPPKPKNNSFLIILLSVLLLLATSLAFFFALQTQKLSKELAQLQVQVQSTPTPTASQAPTGDLANWKTYTNSIDNFSFKYPSTWTIDTKEEKGDDRKENIQVKLIKGKAMVGIGANIVGIGGGPRNVPYEETNLWGKTYYKQYSDMDFTTNTKTIDISDDPHGLGAFKIGTKTYMISLTYPAVQEGDKPDRALSEEFNQILSTFKFINNLSPNTSQ